MLTFFRKTERTLTALVNLMSPAVALGAIAVVYFQSIEAGLLVVLITTATGVIGLVWRSRKRRRTRTIMAPQPA
jgi:hypothetical protein